MFHPLWLTFADKQLEFEYQREKFTQLLSYFYTMSTLWAILAMIYCVWTSINGDYTSAIYAALFFGFGMLICFLVTKLHQSLSLIFMFVFNILCSVIPVIGAYFNNELNDCNKDYYLGAMYTFIQLMFQYTLLIQPRFLLNAFQIIFMSSCQMVLTILQTNSQYYYFCVIVALLPIGSFYEQEKYQRQLFSFKIKQIAFQELINQTVEYPVVISEYDKDRLSFKLLSCSRYGIQKFGVEDQKSFTGLLRSLFLDYKTNVETWMSNKVIPRQNLKIKHIQKVYGIVKEQRVTYRLTVRQLSQNPEIYALIFKQLNQSNKNIQTLINSINYLMDYCKKLSYQKKKEVELDQIDTLFKCILLNNRKIKQLNLQSMKIRHFLTSLRCIQIPINFQFLGMDFHQHIHTDFGLLNYAISIVIKYCFKIKKKQTLMKCVIGQKKNTVGNDESFSLLDFSFVVEVDQKSLTEDGSESAKQSLQHFELTSVQKVLQRLGPFNGYKIEKFTKGLTQTQIITFSIIQDLSKLPHQLRL